MTVPRVVVELQSLLKGVLLGGGAADDELLLDEAVADESLFPSGEAQGGRLSKKEAWVQLESATRWQRSQGHWLRQDALPGWGVDQPVRALEIGSWLRRSGRLDGWEEALVRLREAEAYRALGLQSHSLALLAEASSFAEQSRREDVRLEVLTARGMALHESGDLPTAQRLLDEAARGWMARAGPAASWAERRELSRVLTALAWSMHAADMFATAVATHKEALRVRREQLHALTERRGSSSDVDLILARADVVESLSRLGHGAHRAGLHEEGRR